MDGHGASGGDPCGIRCAGDEGLALAVARERHLLDQLPVPVVFFGRDRRLAWLNHAAALVVNRPPEALLGLLAGEIEPGVPIEGGHEFAEAVGRVMRTGEPESWQSTLTLDGAQHAWRVTLSPVRSPQGELLGVSAATLDTTEQFWARRRMAVLSQASARIGSTLDVRHTARELAELATESFAERVTVDLLAKVWNTEGSGTGPGGGATEPGGGAIEFRRAASASAPDCPAEPGAATGGVHSVARDSLTGRVLEDGEPRGDVSPTPDAPDEDRSPPNGTGTATPNGTGEPPADRAALLVPMVARDTTLGLVTFARRRPHPTFDKADVHLARDLAARTAVCLDNCLRYSRERQTALALQRGLLPDHAAEHQAVDIASCCLQSTSATGIGGDWFDVVPLSGARVALAVGDVVGTGIRATATMGRMRTAVRTLAAVELAPDELLTHLDDIVITLDQEEAAHAGGVSRAPPACTPPTTRSPGAAPSPPRATPSRFWSTPTAMSSSSRWRPVPRWDRAASSSRQPSSLFRRAAVSRSTPTGSCTPPPRAPRRHGPNCTHCSPARRSRSRRVRPRDHTPGTGPARRGRGSSSRPPPPPRRRPAGLMGAAPRPGGRRARPGTRGRPAAGVGLGEGVAFTTELITSELVTNAIRYGADPVVLQLIRDTSSLICEVSDGSSTAPHLRRARTYDEGGRGLLLVASLTQRWGTRYGDSGKTIWAEQPLSQG